MFRAAVNRRCAKSRTLNFLVGYPDDPCAASKTLILDETCNVVQVIVRATSIFRKPVHPDPTDDFRVNGDVFLWGFHQGFQDDRAIRKDYGGCQV